MKESIHRNETESNGLMSWKTDGGNQPNEEGRKTKQIIISRDPWDNIKPTNIYISIGQRGQEERSCLHQETTDNFEVSTLGSEDLE